MKLLRTVVRYAAAARESWKLRAFVRPRSPEWRVVKMEHLKVEPCCQWCGAANNLEVHHIRPFHLFPDLELATFNLITLCMNKDCMCHFLKGHLKDWKSFNRDIRYQCTMHLK